MKYTVVWSPAAERKLASIWVDAVNREVIADVANSLDSQLTRSPYTVGESRPYGQRIAHCLPLGIRFEVHEDDRLVRILTVWLCQPSGR